MGTVKNLTCTSWLSGKHAEGIEINTRLPFFAYHDFFAQGDDASNIIDEINIIYNNDDCSILEAIEKWASFYL